MVSPFGQKPCEIREIHLAASPCHDGQRTQPERLRLPLCLRCYGLVDLPEVAFGIGKVRRAQPPGLVGWGSEKRDSLGLERLVCGVDILNTSGQKHAGPSLDLQRIGLL